MSTPKLFKQSAIASFTALYIGGACSVAVASPGMEKVPGTSFYTPTFTAEDIQRVNDARKLELSGDVYLGQPGQINRIIKKRTPAEIFQPEAQSSGVQTYIVQLDAEPLATYTGDIPGYAATAAPKNRSVIAKGRVSVNTASAQSYKSFLLGKQDRFIAKASQAGVSAKVNKQFTVASNAMVVEMTQDDAIKMSHQSGVKRISLNRIFQLRTDRGPEFIGADKVWQGTATSSNSLNAKGEGMVVGIIDTGINTDHVSFADDEDYAIANPFQAVGFRGDCVESPQLCNNKLVGVYSYPEITDVYDADEFQTSYRPVMIRPANGEDYNGHGSHTASTAAGNALENVPLQSFDGEATSDGIDLPFTFPKVSGVAPRAHVISYQVCWPGGSGDPYAGCPESAILSAFEDAIADGVDAINFSIGGAESLPWADPMELAFLAAREAGISVAVAAGNSGAYWTADHTSPWVTTVGASTHDRQLEAGVKTLDGFEGSSNIPSAAIEGLSFSGGITGQVVLAENFADPDTTDSYKSATCNVPFPEGTFTADQIVVCERGDIARVDKAKNVAAGGAGGIILQNLSSSENLVADSYVIPGIHVKSVDRFKIRNWVIRNGEAARATISDYTNEYTFNAELGNNLATFSSLGPSKTNNTLVPDLTAPGVDIYAANADDQPFTSVPAASDWTFMSGTSMAAPHVTGAMTLLTQLHPDWTPAEIQSALMMTAGPVVLNTGYELVEPFYNFMAGAGAINVARAADTGLVMDETIDNYRNADPTNGGLVNWLNIPSMVEMECERTCSFMRTVKATRDGSWTVEGIGKEEGFDVAVSPAQFSLKAGESQSIIITATTPSMIEMNIEPEDAGLPWSTVLNKDTFFNGQVNLKEVSGNAPDVHMPVVVAAVADQLPVSHRFEITRDQGTETLMVNTDSYSELTPRFYGPVKPEMVNTTLTAVSPFLNPENLEAGWDIRPITIPEGTKRLVVEVLDANMVTTEENLNPRYTIPHPFVAIGRDANDNGTFIPEGTVDSTTIREEYVEEILCLSSSQSQHNYCSIESPAAGTYWIATAMAYGQGLGDVNLDTGYAIIMEDDDRGYLSLSGPASHDGNGNYNIDINWNIPETQAGDIYYGGFDMGSMPGAEGTLGFTALDIRRSDDAVQWSVSQDTARSMDVLDITLSIAPNLETQDRNFKFEVKLPEGMRLATDTIVTNKEEVTQAVVADETGFVLSGVQPTTRDVKRDYKVSTNFTNEMCHTPLIDEYSTGGYIDLFGEFKLQPTADWLVGDFNTSFDVPIDWLFYKEGAKFELYNQPNGGYMRMHTVGALQLNTAYWYMKLHRGPGFLLEGLAPFWRGDFETKYRRNPEDPWGLTIASQYAEDRPDLGDLLFLEFDNVTDTKTGEEFDFEVILRSGIDYRQGQYEIIYAYDNLGADLAKGVVMVEGFDSPYSSGVGPKDGALYQVLGYDNLDEVLSDDLVVCYDYVGPEQSRMEVTFKAVIKPEATGSTMDVTLDYDLEGAESVSMSHAINVQGNIKVAEIADQFVAENTQLSLSVMYVDANKVPNTVEVTGENITAEVNGNDFTITPKKNWHGETTVIVTVRDNEHSGDATSTSFNLTVESDGKEPESAGQEDEVEVETESDDSSVGQEDEVETETETESESDESSVGQEDETESESDDNSVGQEDEVEVEVEVETESKSDDSSGGALGFGLLTLLPLAMLRRRRALKLVRH
ncbi:S8 family serine peptidase [Shewanella sp. AS1]|uniref:S8 family serine peptidase n=1 Tax=Shewanella sp. AS1 TaxID=2907626 RepID=UPI001F221A36|nr:S8 family serine peptidase [Shewanella sp. AS1]MCE9679333.1 S8 family serine peptidase [Shewanella sp. AS1]